MKLLRRLTLLIVLMSTFAVATVHDLRINCETISCYDFNNLDKYKSFRDSDNPDEFLMNHHVNLIRLEDIASGEDKFEFVLVRLVMKNRNHDKVLISSTKDLMKNGKGIKENRPTFILSSAGFLPGEKVGLIARSDNFQSNPIMFIPNPIILQSSKDKAKITAELVSQSPEMYNVNLSGFGKDEKVKFKSVSLGEVMSDVIEVNRSATCVYSPDSVGADGGSSKVSYTRSNGEEFTINFPWGVESVEHHKGKRGPAVFDFSAIKVF